MAFILSPRPKRSRRWEGLSVRSAVFLSMKSLLTRNHPPQKHVVQHDWSRVMLSDIWVRHDIVHDECEARGNHMRFIGFRYGVTDEPTTGVAVVLGRGVRSLFQQSRDWRRKEKRFFASSNFVHVWLVLRISPSVTHLPLGSIPPSNDCVLSGLFCGTKHENLTDDTSTSRASQSLCTVVWWNPAAFHYSVDIMYSTLSSTLIAVLSALFLSRLDYTVARNIDILIVNETFLSKGVSDYVNRRRAYLEKVVEI
ncbi:uncharacterized protein EDB91DRAFT_1306778 [Suillus paluster]|uniref:uncharacterized protein n=1 Tax=Suillus paluster TaxID=48578 RepID=UPI001B873616|nr:uncharacterized protein EDB91DRAFT_1306778 [Suillus paluster]KAG1731066.1 hypothetical protein EDB91DRAFT_1306778 [Suillus paluster]